MGQLSAAAAVLGAFFALGQTASQAIQGYYGHKTELAKARQDLDLAKQKSDSELASTFLNFILKDDSEQRQSILYDALSTLHTHPLHEWAQRRHEAIEKNLAGLAQAREAELAAYREHDEAVRVVKELQAQIQQKEYEIELHREDTNLTQKLHNDQIALVGQLGPAAAMQVRAESKVTITEGGISRDTTIQASATEVVSFHLPIDRIRTALSLPSDRSLYDKYMPALESALIESKITSPLRVAAIVSIAALETDLFRTTVDYSSAKYEGRRDLGNTEAGDGERFRGRGLVQLTGRANYALYSEILGLGTLLVNSPDDANNPEIAARILCAYALRHGVIQPADQGDLVTIIRLVDGGLNGIDRLRAIYPLVKSALAQGSPAKESQ